MYSSSRSNFREKKWWIYNVNKYEAVIQIVPIFMYYVYWELYGNDGVLKIIRIIYRNPWT